MQSNHAGGTKTVRCLLAIALLIPLFCATASRSAEAVAQAELSESSESVRTLLLILRQRQLEAAAAEYPNEPDRFAAILHFPGSQLLAISAISPDAPRTRELIRAGSYHQIYAALNSSSNREGRFFVQDLGADGLRRTREHDKPFDITYRDAVTRTIYDGDWQAQDISAAEYRMRFESDDRRYTELLRIVVGALIGDGLTD